MKRCALVVLSLSLLSPAAWADNRVGDANLDGRVDIADAELVQQRLLGLADAYEVSVLALADRDDDLDLRDLLLIARAARRQETLRGPAQPLSFAVPTTRVTRSGAPDERLLWGVFAARSGVAERTDGLELRFETVPPQLESQLAPTEAVVQEFAALTELTPINTTAADQLATVRLVVPLHDSRGEPVREVTSPTSFMVQPSICGNGVAEPGEACDDGNREDCDGCRGDCAALETGCGDGFLCGHEVCDDGSDNGRCGFCGFRCLGPYNTCGDGSTLCGEACDDGFTDACGSCNADCSGPGEGAQCGDGDRCPELEACDDGFTDACGSCNADCSAEGSGALCGDGVHCPESELCDDGFTDACGSCDATCTGPGSGLGQCGDGVFCAESGEGCDDGNVAAGDGCSAVCIDEAAACIPRVAATRNVGLRGMAGDGDHLIVFGRSRWDRTEARCFNVADPARIVAAGLPYDAFVEAFGHTAVRGERFYFSFGSRLYGADFSQSVGVVRSGWTVLEQPASGVATLGDAVVVALPGGELQLRDGGDFFPGGFELLEALSFPETLRWLREIDGGLVALTDDGALVVIARGAGGALAEVGRVQLPGPISALVPGASWLLALTPGAVIPIDLSELHAPQVHAPVALPGAAIALTARGDMAWVALVDGEIRALALDGAGEWALLRDPVFQFDARVSGLHATERAVFALVDQEVVAIERGPGHCTAVCGNAVAEHPERCDDGNHADGDGCAADCASVAICGDGVVDARNGEVCDDGLQTACGECNADCSGPGSGPGFCGDGVLCPDAGESCDDGYNDACGSCDALCAGPGSGLGVCGDGALCPEAGEDCDDGNTDAFDGCSSVCLDESGLGCYPTYLGEITDGTLGRVAVAAGRGFALKHPAGPIKHQLFETHFADGTPAFAAPLSTPIDANELNDIGAEGDALYLLGDFAGGPALRRFEVGADALVPSGEGALPVAGLHFATRDDRTVVSTADGLLLLDTPGQRAGSFAVIAQIRGVGGSARDLDVSGDEVVVAEPAGDVVTLRREGAVLREVARENLGAMVMAVVRVGERIWVALEHDPQLRILDAADLSERGRSGGGEPVAGFQRAGEVIYAKGAYGMLTTLDARDPDAPQMLRSVHLTGGGFDLDIAIGEGLTLVSTLGFGVSGFEGVVDACPAICGNANVEEGEVCDDGNHDDGDGCASDCASMAHCGDGIVDQRNGELCDEADESDCGACAADCRSVGVGLGRCGDGLVCGAERCDDGYTDDCGSCNATCSGAGSGFGSCGDGKHCPEAGEQCDDGGVGGACDGCTDQCLFTESLCGDGALDCDEGCDDGNRDSGDGCSTICLPEAPGACTPRVLGHAGGRFDALAVIGQELLVGRGVDQLQFFDISDPDEPRPVHITTLPGQAQRIVSTPGMAWVAMGDDGVASVELFNDEVTHYALDGDFRDLAVAGDSVAALDGTSALVTFSAGVPDLSARLDLPGWLYAVAAHGTLAYVAASRSGVHVVDISDPATPVLLRTVGVPDVARDIHVHGDIALVACDEAGLVVLDLADPADPEISGIQAVLARGAGRRVSVDSRAHGVVAGGAFAYTLEPWGNLHRFPLARGECADDDAPCDVREGRAGCGGQRCNPVLEMNHIRIDGQPRQAVVFEERVYVTSPGRGLEVHHENDDLDVPLSAVVRSPGNLQRVITEGNVAYLADNDMGFVVASIRDPQRPTFYEPVDTGPLLNMLLYDGVIFGAANNNGVVVVNVRDAAHAEIATVLRGHGQMQGVARIGQHLITHSYQEGLVIYDIENALDPIEVGRYDQAQLVGGFKLQGTTAWLDWTTSHAAWGRDCRDIVDLSALPLVSRIWHGCYGDTPAESVLDRRFGIQGFYGDLALTVGPGTPGTLGIRFIDVSAAPTLSVHSEHDAQLPGWSRARFFGSHLFIMDGGGSPHLFELSDPRHPRMFGALPIASPLDLDFVGEHAVFARGIAGLDVVAGLQPTCEPPCGNFRVEPGEGCDDGNRDPGDGCSPSCQPEAFAP